jgi:hypothetical protein
METWILIAWLYSLEVAGGGSGYSLATAATSLSVEFDSEPACETAGTELVATEVPRTAPSLRFTTPAIWQYICVPKGSSDG